MGFALRATSFLPWKEGLDTPVLPPLWLQHQSKNDLRSFFNMLFDNGLDHIRVAMTDVMWREEHFRNVSVLQKVPLSSNATNAFVCL
jgi:hypothetical protein